MKLMWLCLSVSNILELKLLHISFSYLRFLPLLMLKSRTAQNSSHWAKSVTGDFNVHLKIDIFQYMVIVLPLFYPDVYVFPHSHSSTDCNFYVEFLIILENISAVTVWYTCVCGPYLWSQIAYLREHIPTISSI